MKTRTRILLIITFFIIATLSSACNEASHAPSDTKWFEYDLYKTVVQYTGENESTLKYLEIAQRSAALFPLLEAHANAFVMDAYNYQSIDDDGTPLYTMNGMDYPQEIDPYGQCIRVSKNYFRYNPIETADGSDLVAQIIYDDLTLNLLVPEKYRDMEAQIIDAYRENFYFEKVQATNEYNEMAGLGSPLDISEDTLKIHLIYVKDGQKYFTFRSDCAVSTDNQITDPIVQIYTSNIHCNYAHSFMTQWLYFYSDAENAADAYRDIEPYITQCGAEKSIREVLSLSDANN